MPPTHRRQFITQLVCLPALHATLGRPLSARGAQAPVSEMRLGGYVFDVEVLASPVNRPWGLAELPDGSFLVTEKNGQLLRISGAAGARQVRRAGDLPDDVDRRLESPADNSGVFDVAVDPAFARTGWIFVAYASAGASAESDGSALAVVRLRWNGTTFEDTRRILLAEPRSRDRFHYGGALLALPDRTLLVTSGERFAWENPQGANPVAQQAQDLRGKILRIDFDGNAPPDNPFTGRAGFDPRVFAWGVRNPQGLAADAAGRIWFTDHGPRRGDELNRLEPGANYGWPHVTCGSYKNTDYRPPAYPHAQPATSPMQCWSDATVAPAGLAWVDHDRLGAWRGSALIAGLGAGNLVRWTPAAGSGSARVEPLLGDAPMRLRDVCVASDGGLLLAVDGERGRVLRLMARTGS
jgi:glucose/arabinose dehydrogenase